MIRTYFGLARDPFTLEEDTPLMEHQQRHFDVLQVYNQQSGLCAIYGEPGTGKTLLKNAIIRHDPKQTVTAVINRSMHTWHNLLRLLCHAMQVDADGVDHKCEARLITEARNLNNRGKMLVLIIDDAHLLPVEALHKVRLLLEDFPKNHNLILFGQPALNTTLQLRPNSDFKSRISYSGHLLPLGPEALIAHIHDQLDRCGLPHRTITEDALHLIVRVSEGILRAVRNLCIGAMIEAVRAQTKTVDLAQVNAVFMQPHWRHNTRDEPQQPVVMTNKKS